MGSQPASQVKTCGICGQDCSNRPRIKDKNGRYYCRPCYDQAAQARASGAPGERQRSSSPSPHIAASPPGEEELDMLAAAAALESSTEALAEESHRGCPGCGGPMAEGAVVCMACGYNRKSGRQMGLQVDRSKPKRAKAGGGGDAATELIKKPWALGLGLLIFYVGFLMMARGNDGLMAVYLLLWNLIGLALFVIVVVKAFGEGVWHGVFSLICGFYWLYFAVFVNDNAHIKYAVAASIVATVMIIAIVGVDALGAMGLQPSPAPP